MRALLPLLSASLCLTLASPAFAGAAQVDQAKASQAKASAKASNAHKKARSHKKASSARKAAKTRKVAHSHARAKASSAARTKAARAKANRRSWAHRHGPGWGRGVFVYSPSGRVAPNRSVDRTGQFSIGLTGGSYVGGYESGTSFGDFGLGLQARYRAAEALGFEVSWEHFRDGSQGRATSPLSLSAEVFAFPWARVSPYGLVGVTWTGRNYEDTYCDGYDFDTLDTHDVRFGPHGGLGVEFAVGDRASVNLEGRLVGYVNQELDDPTNPVAFQSRLGVNLYF